MGEVLSFTYLIKPNQNQTKRQFLAFKKPKPNYVFENWNRYSTSAIYAITLKWNNDYKDL